MNPLTAGRYCAFVVDLGNYGGNNITPRSIFEGLRKTPNVDFTFTQYHWRRSGNFLLQVHSPTPGSAIETAISNAINRVPHARLNRSFSSIIRDLGTLEALVQYAREKTGVAPGSSDVVKYKRPVKVAGVFIESSGDLKMSWPKEVDRGIEVLGMVKEDPATLVALYQSPRGGGDFGYVANAVKVFYGRANIIVRSTARALSVIDDIVEGRMKS